MFGWEEIGRLITWFPLLFLGAYLSIQTLPLAVLAIIGFWLAWELKWWGGADAVAAMTLILIYPEIIFILVILFIHVIATIGLAIRSLVKEKMVCVHKIPGLPLLLIATVSFQILHLLT